MTQHFSSDREVLHTAAEWLDAGHKVALVTVAKTWGSSPRPPGSLLVMRDDGLHEGSVSGGCVEEDLIKAYVENRLSNHYPTLISYGVNRLDALRFGLPCGGRLELIVEQLDSSAPINIVLEKISKGDLVARRVCLNTGEVSLHANSKHSDFHYNANELIKIFGSSWHLLLIGAGHLSRYVANIALMLDYKVTVCDPREDYQATWHTPGTELTRLMPDDAVNLLGNARRSAVITLTHDPKLDDMALMNALTRDLFYVGALGSRRSSEQRRERLSQLGITPQQLSKLHAPVGLDIGSHTPPEIAVSIMGQVTAIRNSSAFVETTDLNATRLSRAVTPMSQHLA